MSGEELNIVILEDRWKNGWEGVADVVCSHCGAHTVMQVVTLADGRSVGFWNAGPGYTVTRTTMKP